MSLDAVLPLIERAEKSDAGLYDGDPDAAAGMAADERGHARALAAMRRRRLARPAGPDRRAASGGTAATGRARCAPRSSG